MEFATLAAAAVAALTPHVKGVVEDFAGAAGEIAREKAKALLQRLKEKFSGDGYMAGTLDRFENADKPEEYAEQVEKLVIEAAEQDAEFASDVQGLVEEIEAAGPTIKVVQKIKEAKIALAAEVGEMTSGALDVEQDLGKVDEGTAVKIGKIGK